MVRKAAKKSINNIRFHSVASHIYHPLKFCIVHVVHMIKFVDLAKYADFIKILIIAAFYIYFFLCMNFRVRENDLVLTHFNLLL